jgi:hypothetical protein
MVIIDALEEAGHNVSRLIRLPNTVEGAWAFRQHVEALLGNPRWVNAHRYTAERLRELLEELPMPEGPISLLSRAVYRIR